MDPTSVDPFSARRRAIPRWRDYGRTLLTGELSSVASGDAIVPTFDLAFFDEKVAAWKAGPSVQTGIELVEAAFVQGRECEVPDAIAYLGKNHRDLPPGSSSLLFSIHSEQEGTTTPAGNSNVQKSARQKVAALRALLAKYPKHAYWWVDLARAHSILGNSRQAQHAMRIALSIAPNDRFVLRSASRLYVHDSEPDRAVQVLRRSSRLKSDPWLVAAEISASSIAELAQQNIKPARAMIKSKSHAQFHLSELASAVGTEEMFSGSVTPARKYFRVSLEKPTDNSVAQGQWANQMISGIAIPDTAIDLPFSYEARTRLAVLARKWGDVLSRCEEWLIDEPFSSAPAIAGSFYAIVTEQDPSRAENYARTGLQANPDDIYLRNNLAVALALQDRPGDARAELVKIAIHNMPPGPVLCMVRATQGLISFRERDFEMGRRLYAEAIDDAEKRGLQRVVALASFHLAREELRVDRERALKAYQRALNASKSDGDPNAKGVMKELEASVGKQLDEQSKLILPLRN